MQGSRGIVRERREAAQPFPCNMLAADERRLVGQLRNHTLNRRRVSAARSGELAWLWPSFKELHIGPELALRLAGYLLEGRQHFSNVLVGVAHPSTRVLQRDPIEVWRFRPDILPVGGIVRGAGRRGVKGLVANIIRRRPHLQILTAADLANFDGDSIEIIRGHWLHHVRVHPAWPIPLLKPSVHADNGLVVLWEMGPYVRECAGLERRELLKVLGSGLIRLRRRCRRPSKGRVWHRRRDVDLHIIGLRSVKDQTKDS
mmetsp:Transcript_2021/g.5687  ORF Transcript_2021/g.5687 Transcript_2021/m.5687 type:complete len:258 (+) Transcript_2021:430-1203(+)